MKGKFMERMDKNLAFMLKYENIAWYENGKVKILDRRIYPIKEEFVVCNSHKEVAKAITDMVTQSGGPYLAAGMGMALAAYECRDKNKDEIYEYLKEASKTLYTARPTTSKRMEVITEKCIEIGMKALEEGKSIDKEIFLHSIEEVNNKYIRINKIAKNLVEILPNKGTILTQCFGETVVGLMLQEIKNKNKDIKIICAETRPYFQGARLTASVAYDQGFDVTVVTDNMIAYCMNEKMIDLFTSASDAITLDGYVVNKVGTMQIAILCKYFNIPYYTTGIPDYQHKTIDSVKIEMRDPNLVLEAMGTRISKKGVKAIYPSFDITPPDLITGIITNKGIFEAKKLKNYFNC